MSSARQSLVLSSIQYSGPFRDWQPVKSFCGKTQPCRVRCSKFLLGLLR